jgi:hypothetical protein
MSTSTLSGSLKKMGDDFSGKNQNDIKLLKEDVEHHRALIKSCQDMLEHIRLKAVEINAARENLFNYLSNLTEKDTINKTQTDKWFSDIEYRMEDIGNFASSLKVIVGGSYNSSENLRIKKYIESIKDVLKSYSINDSETLKVLLDKLNAKLNGLCEYAGMTKRNYPVSTPGSMNADGSIANAQGTVNASFLSEYLEYHSFKVQHYVEIPFLGVISKTANRSFHGPDFGRWCLSKSLVADIEMMQIRCKILREALK